MKVALAVWVLGSFPLGVFLGLVIRFSRRHRFSLSGGGEFEELTSTPDMRCGTADQHSRLASQNS
jgi:hypothetical protein